MNATKLTRLLMRGLLALVLVAGMQHMAVAQDTVEYIHTDALGSPVAITDASGNVIERTVYEPYGAVVGGVVKDGPGYTGHVSDSATGLSYMQQRYYEPSSGAFLSVDPVTAYGGEPNLFNRYTYAFNNPYRFTDPDGRCPVCAVVIFFVMAMTHSEPANAPAPGEALARSSPSEAIGDAVPGGKAIGQIKSVANMAEKMSQRAAHRAAKRDSGIPTSQQASSQTNGRASDGTPIGRQQSYDVPKSGGGTETKSVQVSRDTRGEHAGLPQVEAGSVKSGGQLDPGGRPRITNETKVRVDFDPKL